MNKQPIECNIQLVLAINQERKTVFTNKNIFPMLGNLLNRTFLFLLAFAGTTPLFAQLNDMEMTDANTAPYTPESLITNVFLGEGVEVTSMQFDGDPGAIGFFKNGLEEIGIDRGIVMTTGRAATQSNNMGSDGRGSDFASGDANPNITVDADLTQLVSDLPNNDIARYTISFIPTSDTVRFKYSFASEEYPEYACSPFNDIFGFFISGPGINGPFSNNADNIAVIPGTGEFVSINNLHPENGSNCPAVNEQYYNSNNGSNTQPVYDGITDVFIAEAIVMPCMEYTIKLVIADKGDTAFDSGVFLEAKSFGSPALDVDLVTLSPDGTIVEGCSEGSISIGVPEEVEEDRPLDYTILGTAMNGLDYQEIPLDLFIPAGESSITIPIIAFEDGLDEGSETICIDIQLDVCNRDTFCIYINDGQLVEPDLGDDISQCQADTVQLMGELDLELPEPPSFTSTSGLPIEPANNSIYSPIIVAGVQPFTLGEGVIQSVCVNIDHSWVDDLDLFLISPSGQFVELSTDNGANGDDYINACFTPEATTPINSPGPFAPFEAAPFTGDWLPEGPWEDLWFSDGNSTNGEWQLLLIDDSNGFPGELVDWTITFEPLFQVNYKWAPSAGLSCDDCPNPIASPQETTTYTLTACDSYGCIVTDSVTIFVENSLPAPNVICSGVSEGCVTFSWAALPGAVGYEVSINGAQWIPSNGPTSHEICGLGFSEQVFIEVRGLSDCNGFIGSAECTSPPCDGAMPTVEMVQPVTCNGGNNGALTVSATGTAPPFIFTANGITNNTGIFENLPAGIYDVSILDAGNCEVILPIEITEPAALEVQNAIQNHVRCNGANDGSATAIIFGGSAPFAFEWSNGETDSIAIALPPGINNVDITDAEGCMASLSITITEPTAMTATTTNEAIQCSGDNTGSASVMASGGQSPYTYLWNDDQAQTQSTATNLTAGTYEVIVTDNSGCSLIEMLTIVENAPISSTSSNTDATCNGTPDGTATAEGQGSPFGFYTYLWDENANSQTTSTAVDLDVGVYYVTISDFFNCSIIDSVEVTSPNAMVVDYTSISTFCPESMDGQASVTVSGGVMPYTYNWADNGATTPDRADLPSGITIVTVTDANDCFVELEVDVPSPTPIEAILEVTDALCAGENSGSVTCTISPTSGGTAPYTYIWQNGDTNEMTTNVGAGTVCVLVTDNNGCQVEFCAEVNEPAQLQVSFGATSVSCFGGNDGSIDLTVEGGTPDMNGEYIYTWSNGNTSQDATNLTAGLYTFDVMDANGCTVSGGSYTIEEPMELTATTAFTPSSCNGDADGTATANATGGTEPYTYAWDDTPNSTTQTASNLLDGTFNVTITDANGCTFETLATLPTPELIFIDNISGTDVDCNGGTNGTANVVASGGTGTLYYEWVNTPNITANATNLTAATYTVIITDDAGCEASETITINEPEAINANLSQVSAFCFNGNDGTASVTNINYGNTPATIADFTFAWNTVPVQTTPTATGLTGGENYSVVITDATGCFITENITVDNPAEIGSAITNTVNVSCFAENDGEATVSADGGTAPYSYAWGATANNQTTATARDLTAGNYSVLVTDANGCTTNADVQITEPALLALTFDAEPTSCGGTADGFARAIATGGTMPYTYAWPAGETAAEVSTLAAASYMVTITDANGCTVEEEVRIEQPEPVVTTIMSIQDVSCAGLNDGMLEVSSTGGTYPYSYSLDGENYIGSSTLIALEAGVYDLFIQDANGCEYIVADIQITEPNPIELDLGTDIVIEFGDEPTLNADVVNGQGNLLYEWRPIGPNELTCYDCATTTILDLSYQLSVELTVTDENGCSASDIILIQVNKNRKVVVPTGFAPNDDGPIENNTLHVHGHSGTEIKLFQVFDRWGNVLYEATDFMINDMTIGWDGTFRSQDMPNGVYVWYIEVEYEDGEEGTFKGNTTLVR